MPAAHLSRRLILKKVYALQLKFLFAYLLAEKIASRPRQLCQSALIACGSQTFYAHRVYAYKSALNCILNGF